jgi:tRNA (guanine37-N1)-methyltransferase
MSAPFAVAALTLFPEAFPGTLALSVIGRALQDGLWSLEAKNIRSFAKDKHHTVDDAPFGGGPGLVMRADIAAAAIDAVPRNDRPLIYLSPRGKPLTQAMAQDWARGPGLIVVCGRFEGLDERVIAARGMQEVSVGDAVLSGGEAAALVLIEATVRLLPGVLGNADSAAQDSFSDGLLEHPHFTKPRVWEGLAVPDVLLSGDHGAIDAWRRAERERLTRERRPDLAAPPRDT